MFSIVVVSIYIPVNSTRGFPLSTSSPAFIVCRFFNDGHSNQCEVIPHCSFDFHFSNKTLCVCVCVCLCLCELLVQLCLTLVTQAPLSMGLSSQEHWSRSHSLLYGAFLTQGLNQISLIAGGFLTTRDVRKSQWYIQFIWNQSLSHVQRYKTPWIAAC